MTIVAAFDFDGTLTNYDTLLPFLNFYEGTFWASCKLGTVAPFIAFDVLRKAGRQACKERVLTRFFRGVPMEALRAEGEVFAKTVLADHVRKDALKRFQWHKNEGHRCVLVSAQIDAYLEAWGKCAGFDDVICSRMASDSKNCATGRLIGLNCWGPEKVRRLEELIGPKENYTLYAYGDSRGDRELLAFANHAFLKEIPDV